MTETKKLDSRLRGNDEVEVTRNLKQAKPNELDSHFRGNDGMQVRGNDGMQVRGNDVVQVRGNDVVQVSVWMDSSFPRRRESRHSILRQFIGND